VLFGVLGLVITSAGIYGVTAYVVEQRTSEIGVRMALGASPARVLSMVLQKAMVLIAAGIVTRGVAAWQLSATVPTFLFEVQPHDPRIFLIALAIPSTVGLVASAIPARRAARVDPLSALRQE
jgi:ABC-type antimicrobial peptide transport system permease subunit